MTEILHLQKRLGLLEAAVDIAMVAVSSGKQISPEMSLLLALVIFDGYTIGEARPVQLPLREF